MASKERKVLKRADLVLVTARSLLTKRLAFNENTHFVSNGVDYALFANAHHVKGKLPDRLRNLPRPIAGFMGLITYWLDEDLLHRFCQAWSGSVVFIGPCENQDIVTSLSSNRNFHYLGAVPRRSDLIPYVGNFDVCLVPFKRTDLTTRMNPLKVYEYLAAGKPVVSVDLPELRELQDVVALATSESEFIRQAEAAVKHDSETAVQRRMAVARMYSWESLVEDVSLLIEKTLALKKNR
jgi:glycosyltransferase involved in cell wall biosynthesis